MLAAVLASRVKFDSEMHMNLIQSIRNQYSAAFSPPVSEARCFFLKMVLNQKYIFPDRKVEHENSVC